MEEVTKFVFRMGIQNSKVQIFECTMSVSNQQIISAVSPDSYPGFNIMDSIYIGLELVGCVGTH